MCASFYCPIYFIGFGGGMYYYYAELCGQGTATTLVSYTPLSPMGCNNPTSPPCVQVGQGARAASDGYLECNGVLIHPACVEAFAENCGHPFSAGWWMEIPGVVEPQYTDCLWQAADEAFPRYFRLFTLLTKCNHQPQQQVVLRMGAQLNILKHPNKGISKAEKVELHPECPKLATVTLKGNSFATFLL